MSQPTVTAILPSLAVEGARVDILGTGFATSGDARPQVEIGGRPARVVYASGTRIGVIVPLGEGGRVPVRVAGMTGETASIEVATTLATGLHQVDNPVFDREGNLYVTYSGMRGQQVPVSNFRTRPNGTRETFSSGIINPTSMAIDPAGRLYVSSRFEGIVYRLDADGTAVPFATDLGVACGLAFAPDGTLFVGDRSGTVFAVSPTGHATAFASLPASVAAFHLALGPDGVLFVTAPTLSSYDAVYQIDERGSVGIRSQDFGRPQGLAFDPHGSLFVVEALAGSTGLYRLPDHGAPELVVSAPALIGVAFNPQGGCVVCSNDTAYRLTR